MHRTTVIWLVLILFLAGCAGSKPTRFYLLDSGAPPAEPTAPGSIVLGLEPVTLPAYLDRPDIVTRSTPNRLNLAEFDRWAEPLDANVARVLADDLAAYLPAYSVVIVEDRPARTDLDLRLRLDRFERQASGEVLLAASWAVQKASSRKPRKTRSATIREPVLGNDYDAVVAAMSRALDRLSRQIAADLERP